MSNDKNKLKDHSSGRREMKKYRVKRILQVDKMMCFVYKIYLYLKLKITTLRK